MRPRAAVLRFAIAVTTLAACGATMCADSTFAQAMMLAESGDSRDHQSLARVLTSADGLNQLDSAQARTNQAPHTLRLHDILTALARNRAPSANALLAQLTAATPFTEPGAEETLLIGALALSDPLPQEALAYWRDRSGPNTMQLFLVIDALCENSSGPALSLLAERLASPAYQLQTKTTWLRTSLLPRRDRLTVLAHTEQWIRAERFTPEVERELAKALFDYQPDLWYPPDGLVEAPLLERSSMDVLLALIAIGTQLLERGNLGDAEQAVLDTLNRADSIIERRNAA